MKELTAREKMEKYGIHRILSTQIYIAVELEAEKNGKGSSAFLDMLGYLLDLYESGKDIHDYDFTEIMGIVYKTMHK